MGSTSPKWAAALLRRVAPPDRIDDVLGDLEEAHLRRVRRVGRVLANVLMGVCMLSCVVPTWHALRIAPTEAMRSNG